jgi:peptide deformylase
VQWFTALPATKPAASVRNPGVNSQLNENIGNHFESNARTTLESAPMARLTILEYPDPRLRTRAALVTTFDAALVRLVDDMFETMYAAPGIGLAATQVDVHQRLIVMDTSKDQTEPLVFINPEIIARDGVEVTEEGCLSVPGIFEEVERADRVTVRALDRAGAPFERELDGIAAVCLQHEMDHLTGKLFVDYLSELKRERIRKKLDKDRKERATRTRSGGSGAAAL